MASGKDPRKEGVPLDEIALGRGAAQEQSANTLHAAQLRFQNTQPDATRDPIYDAIEGAKRQIAKKEKTPLDGGQADAEEEKRETDEESAGKGILGSVGEKISGYAKNIKGAVGGGDEAASRDVSK